MAESPPHHVPQDRRAFPPKGLCQRLSLGMRLCISARLVADTGSALAGLGHWSWGHRRALLEDAPHGYWLPFGSRVHETNVRPPDDAPTITTISDHPPSDPRFGRRSSCHLCAYFLMASGYSRASASVGLKRSRYARSSSSRMRHKRPAFKPLSLPLRSHSRTVRVETFRCVATSAIVYTWFIDFSTSHTRKDTWQSRRSRHQMPAVHSSDTHTMVASHEELMVVYSSLHLLRCVKSALVSSMTYIPSTRAQSICECRRCKAKWHAPLGNEDGRRTKNILTITAILLKLAASVPGEPVYSTVTFTQMRAGVRLPRPVPNQHRL
jgi:hypothetical protein